MLDAKRFPPVSTVALTLLDEIVNGHVWTPLAETAFAWLVSLFLSFALALALAVGLNLSVRLRDYTAPVVAFLRPMPCTALIPLVIVSIGANTNGLVFLTTFGALWQMLPGLAHAFGKHDTVAQDTARVFRFSGWQTFRWLTLPALEPYMLSALRIGATASLVLLIGMELLTGAAGIGRLIAFAYAGSNLTLMYAYVALSGLLGVATNLLLGRAVTRRAARVGGRSR
ncbi:ABC transporter permease [Chitinasiproducens palmae]|nr:ABC transporter permease subunit [Chitinasiproducens palmae]